MSYVIYYTLWYIKNITFKYFFIDKSSIYSLKLIKKKRLFVVVETAVYLLYERRPQAQFLQEAKKYI